MPASKTGDAVYDCGIDLYFKQLYFEKYIKLDPLTIGHYFAEIEEPVSVTDLMSYDEFLESRAYLECGQPQGLVDVLNVALDKTATSAAMFCVFRHTRDGLVDDEMRRRMKLIVPHIRRAVLIARLIDLKTEEATNFAEAFDGLKASVFLVDASGRIMHANVAGYTLLRDEKVLRSARGCIVAMDFRAQQVLYDVLVAAGRGDTALGVKGISIPMADRNGENYSAHILPLTSGARRQKRLATRAAAAIFVHKAALSVQSPLEVLAKRYRLTPTELRVLLAIVEVGGGPEVADALGVSQSTVHTHLKRIYVKTGAHRQADLVKLVAAFSNPLVA